MTLDRSGVDKEFDVARARVGQQEAAQLQAQKDALARRAAQTGGGVNGALIKQEAIAADASAQRTGLANEAIDAQKNTELRRIGEMEAGMNFQREERESGQTFQADQTAKQIEAQRDAQTRQIEAAAAEGKLTREQAQKQLDEVTRQFDAEMTENKKTNYISTIISAHNSGIPREQIADLLTQLGVGFNKDGLPMINVPGLTTPSVTDGVKDYFAANPLVVPGTGGTVITKDDGSKVVVRKTITY